MKLPVGLKAPLDVAQRAPLGEHRGAHPGERLRRAQGGGEPGGARFDHGPRLVGLPHPDLVDVGHARASVGPHLDEPLRGQAAQRLAHRRAGDAELLGQVLLMHPRAAGSEPLEIRSRIAVYT